MKVGDVMTKEVISVAPGASVAEAAKLMLQERISGLPVISESSVLVGIVTEGDLLRRVETGTDKKRPRWLELIISPNVVAKEYVHSHSRSVFDVMTRNVHIATEDMPITTAVELMESERVKRLPVVREGRVVGIIARANLLHALTAGQPQPEVCPRDEAIRQTLEHELEKKPWSTRQFHFVVKDGIVNLWGFFSNEHQRDAIRVAAANTPGVKAVRDHMDWFEPYSGIIMSEGEDGRHAILH